MCTGIQSRHGIYDNYMDNKNNLYKSTKFKWTKTKNI